jgi:DNA-binding IclR family transcriptional regulator
MSAILAPVNTHQGGAMGADRNADGTVGKALDVLDLVARRAGPVRFSDLMQQCDFPKATLYRLVQTLTHQGMLSHDPERGTYALGLRLVRLAHAAWAQSSLAPIARAHLDALSAETGETIHLAQMDHGQVLYVDKRNAARPVEMFAQAGKVGPAYCTGVGKAMLAHLPPEALEEALARQSFHPHTPHTLASAEALLADLEAIRTCRYALDRQEHETGIICCAVPILTRAGRVIGALSVTSTTARTTLEALAAQAPRIREVADRIAADAGDWRFPEQT